MGYDMYIEDDAGLSEDRRYFRLNIMGMPPFRDAMEQLDMLTWRAEHAEWPEFPAFAEKAYREKIEGEWTPEEEAAIKGHRVACQRVTDSDTGGVIPGYKLCSNDGWLVTPGEIHSALAAYQRHSQAHVRELVEAVIGWDDGWSYWKKWIRFLTRAEERGGFRVW